MRVIHPSPGAVPPDSAAFSPGTLPGEGVPLVTARRLPLRGTLRHRLHAGTGFGVKESSACRLSPGLGKAPSPSVLAVWALNTGSSVAPRGVHLWRPQKALRSQARSSAEGDWAGGWALVLSMGIGGLCPPPPPLPALPRGHQNDKDRPSPGWTLRFFQPHKGKIKSKAADDIGFGVRMCR